MPKTLLLADDSVTIQRVVELTFAHEDVRIVAVGDGRRAVQYLESERPDLVLLDVELPEINGFEIAARIRKSPRLRHVPILLLAGAFEAVDEGRARAAGTDGVIKKPFEPEQLVSRVKELLTTGSGAARVENVRDWSNRPSPAAPAQPVSVPAAMPVQAVAAGGSRLVEPMSVSRREPMAAAGGGGGYTPDPPIRSVPGFPGLTQPTATPEPLEPPRPIWETVPPRMPEPARGAAPAAPPKVSLSNAFSALLAAEQTNPASAAPAPATTVIISEAAIEEAVRRVLVKMTDDVVHRIVLETAERLIREELDKIRSEGE